MQQAGLSSIRQLEFVKGKPVLLGTLLGRDPALPSILLNGHYDVVPADEEKWEVDPFSGERIDGRIYGRGSQDMKCVVIQYLEALKKLRKRGKKLRRTIHVTFLPDEEIGGLEGAALFVQSEAFSALKVGFALDEGLASGSVDRFLTAFHGERAANWMIFRAEGPTGHGSRFIQKTAIEKLVGVMGRCYKVRAEQEAVLSSSGCGSAKRSSEKKLGDVLTLNITALKGGVEGGMGGFALNVIPEKAMFGMDLRVPLDVDRRELDKMVEEWIGGEEGISVEYVVRAEHPPSPLDPKSSQWWQKFEEGLEGWEVRPEVFPAGTDGRYFRNLNIPCIGFSPLFFTPILLHDHNEFLHEKVFVEGVKIYEKLILKLGDWEGE